MLILLPPSEGKAVPSRGRPFDPTTLSYPELTDARSAISRALVRLCQESPRDAIEVLGVPASQPEWVTVNAELVTRPAARADAIYTGVLYDALGLGELSPAARRRAAGGVAITSSLWGLVAPHDRIPSYRLSGDARLPGLPATAAVAAVWRDALDAPLRAACESGPLIDLRSTTYAAFWRPPAEIADRVVTVRVLHEVGGRRSIVSHFNKATKGRLVRDLLEDGGRPRRVAGFLSQVRDLGWTAEAEVTPGKPARLDVIVSDL